MPRLVPAFALAVATIGSACGEDFVLPPAQVANRVDTVVLYAIDGTPLTAPSAYNLVFGQTIRTDRTSDFDFAVNVSGDTTLLFPTGAMGLSDWSGWVRVPNAFDEVLLAPSVEYVAEEPAVLALGDVLVLRSRFVSCFGSQLPVYGKIEVLATSLENRSVSLQLLLNRNCGYRGLEPGTPAQ